MRYSIYGYINGSLELESSIETDFSDLAFQSLVGMVNCVKEQAYEDCWAWEVVISAYDSKTIAYKSIYFFGSDPHDVWTDVNGNSVNGQWDELLSMWLDK